MAKKIAIVATLDTKGAGALAAQLSAEGRISGMVETTRRLNSAPRRHAR